MVSFHVLAWLCYIKHRYRFPFTLSKSIKPNEKGIIVEVPVPHKGGLYQLTTKIRCEVNLTSNIRAPQSIVLGTFLF